jgi:BirA family biotin operon repressor/biotin-[acetyl-CoA-carboxylase] ligase
MPTGPDSFSKIAFLIHFSCSCLPDLCEICFTKPLKLKNHYHPPFPTNWQWIELPETESTNNYAMGLVHALKAQEGLCVFTHHQTKGKGRMGKEWLTSRNENIALSIVLQPSVFSSSDTFSLSIAVALAVLDFFSGYAGDDTSIKWPNDIYWRDRKAGGILIENVITASQPAVGNWQFAVVGIGLNINQQDFDKELTRAVSLKQITGKEYNPADLAKELCGFIYERWTQLKSENQQLQLQEYNDHLFRRNEKVKLKKRNIVFEALIKEVDFSGHLVVNTSMEEKFTVDEVNWLF